MKRVEATPTPVVLVWARKTAGMSVDVAAQKADVKPEQLSSWEAGATCPSIPQLRKLATVYRRPLAAFYLAAPRSASKRCMISGAFRQTKCPLKVLQS